MQELGGTSRRGSWRLALEPAVVRRALKIAAVVGALLIAINHGDRILEGAVDARALFKMGLTLLVPYAVSTVSSVAAIREMRARG